MHPILNVINGDALKMLTALPANSVQCCVTSPPYWGLRDYKIPPTAWPDGWVGCLGLEPTPEMFIDHTVMIFEEVRRVLRRDGTLWVNIGDSYAAGGRGGGGTFMGERGAWQEKSKVTKWRPPAPGLKRKDLVMIPFRLALGLQAAGWYFRSDIIWHKMNPMPSSVRDRPTPSHEYVFLLAKSGKYYYNAQAIEEPCSPGTHARLSQNVEKQIGSSRANGGTRANRPMKAVAHTPRKDNGVGWGHGTDAVARGRGRVKDNDNFAASVCLRQLTRNKRSVWSMPTQGYDGAHFATYPEALVRLCALAGSRPGDMILDPFGGSGTTGKVALELGRSATLIELNPEYCKLIEQRCTTTIGLPLAAA